MRHSIGLKVIGALAVVQSVADALRALQFFDIGTALLGEGLLLIPMVGMLVYGRGVIVVLLAILYLVFAFGVFSQRSWARSLGIAVSVVNLVLVLIVVVGGESIGQVMVSAMIPLIIAWYLLAPAGREALGMESEPK